MKTWLVRILFFGLLIVVWEAVVRLGIWPKYIIPSFYDVLRSIWTGFVDGTFPRAILYSLWRLAAGYGISLLVGITLGMLIGRIPIIQQTVGSVILGLQALPSVCWLPLALLWFGLSERAIIFVVIMGALLSISLSTADGIRNTPPLFLQAAKTMGAAGIRLYSQVILPAAFPSIISGMKLGWSFAWRSLMAGELLYYGGKASLGHLLTMGRELNDMAQVISVMIIIVAIGLLVDFLVFAPFERRIRERWGLRSIR
ncbi:MAG: ABC transporter permease [Anaerolineales bacterium]|nr:ABC transporter permease [Anaerolineales bacterium]